MFCRFGSLEETGLPALVKSRRLGYDGKGQRRVDSPEAVGADEIAEELVSFDRELSIVGVRGREGETKFWPVGENVHRDVVDDASLHGHTRPKMSTRPSPPSPLATVTAEQPPPPAARPPRPPIIEAEAVV